MSTQTKRAPSPDSKSRLMRQAAPSMHKVTIAHHNSKLEGIKNGAEAVLSAIAKYGGALWLLADDVNVGPPRNQSRG